MYDFRQEGWVEAICGSMYAGKTEELIRRLKRLDFARRSYCLFKPTIDNRYSDTKVVSHAGSSVESHVISDPKQILEMVKPSTAVIAIDEVQFFDDSVCEVCNTLAKMGKRVMCAGLDTDFRGEPFGPMPKLITQAEFVTKLTAVCNVCGAPATRTQRMIDGRPANYDDPIVLVGAKEQYEARCRHCHAVEGKPTRE